MLLRSAVAEERRADPDVASRPPRRRPGSPGSCPSRARVRPCSAASSRSRRKYGRDVSGSSVDGGIVISPRTSRVELEERRRAPPARRPDFVSSPREVHLDERRDRELRRGRLRVERVAELADRVDDLRLAALQVADEVPAERIAVARVLRLEILRAVLADDVDAGVDEHLPARRRRRTSSRRRSCTLGADLRLQRARSARAICVRRRRQ